MAIEVIEFSGFGQHVAGSPDDLGDGGPPVDPAAGAGGVQALAGTGDDQLRFH
ncbi:hypothetical protein [Streptomyces spiralis]|uniref:hypothetical protein n=1 Tax=Streptomyces spiralis TaxID=66376 RepID=UPI0036BEE593